VQIGGTLLWIGDTEFDSMRKLSFLFLLLAVICNTQAQNLKITLSKVREVSKDNDFTWYEAQFKVVSGAVSEDRVPLALPLPNGKKGFVLLEPFGEQFKTGQSTQSPVSFKAIGCQLKDGQTLVSHDLAPVKAAPGETFKFQVGTAFIDVEPKAFFTTIKTIEGLVRVGDALEYVNDRGQKGRGKVIEINVASFSMPTDAAFGGLPDNSFSIKVLSNEGVDFSDATAVPAGSGALDGAVKPQTEVVKKSNAKIKSIPVNAVLENSEVKITVHNLVKYNPVKGEGIDLFKIDYSLDYYIVDATFENKTPKPLDCGDYLLRFNFFSPEGKSADEFTRLFKAGQTSGDDAQKSADKVDTEVFGGTGKLVMANVLAKYQETIPNYDTQHKANTAMLNKPLPPGQKVRSVDATIMGVPPTYKIVGLGTWKGTFFDKKNVVFTPVRIP
jgi:hypothetical protein